MAKRFLTNIDLNQNEIQNVAIHKLSGPPGTPILGQIYFNTTDELLYIYTTSGWESMAGDIRDIVAHADNAANLLITDDTDPGQQGVKILNILLATAGLDGLMSKADFSKLLASTDAATGSALVQRDAEGDASFVDVHARDVFLTGAITNDTQAPTKKYVDDLFSTGTRIIGKLDCAGNPNYPLADAGDTYYVGTPGLIGGALGTPVDSGDMMICVVDSAEGIESVVGMNWIIVEHNIEAAREDLAGVIRIATQTEVDTGTDDTIAVTPLKLTAAISSGSYTGLVAPAGSTSYAVNHGLNSTDVIVQVKETASGELVECDVFTTSVGVVTLTFAVSPADNFYTVTVRR